DLYRNPKNEYVAALLGDYSVSGKNKHITRPEDWKIEKNKNGNGRVEAIALMGSYHLVHVKMGSDTIAVYSQNPKLKMGDTVKLELKKK
ncbi:MAG: TOBE domain-containing protein, partial [Bacteroidota bacterium]